MDNSINSYLPLNFISPTEEQYLANLMRNFTEMSENEHYHFALFAYHLLFMSFVCHTLFKIKLWHPDKFELGLSAFPKDKFKKYKNASSPFAFAPISESTLFDLLRILGINEGEITICKNQLVKPRNDRSHASGIWVKEKDFNESIECYDKSTASIQLITHSTLLEIFNEWKAGIDPEITITYDLLELEFIINNHLNTQDLKVIYDHTIKCPDQTNDAIYNILVERFEFE